MKQSCLRPRTGDNCSFNSSRHFDTLQAKVKHELSAENKEKG